MAAPTYWEFVAALSRVTNGAQLTGRDRAAIRTYAPGYLARIEEEAARQERTQEYQRRIAEERAAAERDQARLRPGFQVTERHRNLRNVERYELDRAAEEAQRQRKTDLLIAESDRLLEAMRRRDREREAERQFRRLHPNAKVTGKDRNGR